MLSTKMQSKKPGAEPFVPEMAPPVASLVLPVKTQWSKIGEDASRVTAPPAVAALLSKMQLTNVGAEGRLRQRTPPPAGSPQHPVISMPRAIVTPSTRESGPSPEMN